MAALNTYAIFTILSFVSWELTTASQELLPHPCDSVKCPSLAELSCPEDSDVRETLLSIALLQAITAAPTTSTTSASPNATADVGDELYAQCCLGKKCICKTCYIPDCHDDGDVVVEIEPESMDTPGRCCGLYNCQKEPNCTEVHNTESYWLTNCQRCKCYSGERICHQSCDEGIVKNPTAICTSKRVNSFYEHGERWRDGCYECECVNGEEKCVMPFCRSLGCPPHRQVMLKDSCCPICWPKGNPIPTGDGDYNMEEDEDDDDGTAQESGSRNYDDEDVDDEDTLPPLPHPAGNYSENEIDTLPHIHFDEQQENTEPKAESTASSTTQAAGNEAAVVSTSAPVVDATPAPCKPEPRHDAPATYQLYPEVVEVVRHTQQNDVLYIVIGFLVVVLVVLIVWNIRLRAKQRSYRPVSNTDDFNKVPPIIKKMNDYV